MDVLLDRINENEMLNIQLKQNQEAIFMADTVPANSQKMQKVSVSNPGAFAVLKIQLRYTTLAGGVVPGDTGLDYLSGKLIDGSNMKPLFNDYVPFGLWAVPGRRKALPAAGSDSFQNAYEFEWRYLFQINADILLDVKNTSDSINYYEMLFVGIRIRSSATTAGL